MVFLVRRKRPNGQPLLWCSHICSCTAGDGLPVRGKHSKLSNLQCIKLTLILGYMDPRYDSSLCSARLIWLEYPQIAPLKYRHIGAAVGLFGEWLFSFVTVIAGGIGLETSGWKIWIWPLIFNVLGFVFVYFMCPDVSALPSKPKKAILLTQYQIADRENSGRNWRSIWHGLQITTHFRREVISASNWEYGLSHQMRCLWKERRACTCDVAFTMLSKTRYSNIRCTRTNILVRCGDVYVGDCIRDPPPWLFQPPFG